MHSGAIVYFGKCRLRPVAPMVRLRSTGSQRLFFLTLALVPIIYLQLAPFKQVHFMAGCPCKRLAFCLCACVALGLVSGLQDLVKESSPFSSCVYSEPTPITHEQPIISGRLPRLRLDYILANAQAVMNMPNVSCLIRNNTVLERLSDHLPVLCTYN